MSLTKEAIEKIESMAQNPEEMKIGDKTYTTKPVYEVKTPTVKEAIKIHTLQGIVDYIDRNIDSLKLDEIAVHIESPTKVNLISKLHGDWLDRNVFVESTFKNSGHPFGRPMDKESFIVSLMSNFEKTKGSTDLLASISSIKKSDSEITDDDGVSQSFTAKAGVTLVAEKKIENPISLNPIRTFTEVDGQPQGDYVFRLSEGRGGGLDLTLHDANGDEWEIKAIDKIKAFFSSKLPESVAIFG